MGEFFSLLGLVTGESMGGVRAGGGWGLRNRHLCSRTTFSILFFSFFYEFLRECRSGETSYQNVRDFFILLRGLNYLQ